MNKYKHILYLLLLLLIGFLVFKVVYKESGYSNESENITSSLEYTNEYYNFSFEYPSGLTIDEISEDIGETIVVKGDLGSFQIHITPFDEGDIVISKERIESDIPGINISENENVSIGKLARGLAFTLKGKDLETTEVWFVYKDSLYQISAPLAKRDFLVKILTTWKFVEV